MIEEVTHSLIQLFREHVEQNIKLSAGSIVEISKVPVIVIDGPLMTEKKRLMRDPERITAIDEEAGKAVREVPPRWYDMRFNVNITCESNSQLMGVFRKLSRLNQACPLLTAQYEERKREYLWRWEKFPDSVTVPNVSQVFQARGILIVYDVEIYSGVREDYSLIEKVQVEVGKMKECLIRNLSDSPCDYPLNDGSSIYFGGKGRSTGVIRLSFEKISEAMRAAERKGLLEIEEIPNGEALEQWEQDCHVK